MDRHLDAQPAPQRKTNQRHTIELQSVRVSPFTGLVHLKGLVVGNPEGFHTESAAQIGEFKVQVSLPSLLTDKIVIKEILIDGPQITYERSLRSDNFAALQKNVEAFVGTTEEAAKEEELTIVVQVNGKVRSRINVAADIEDEQLKEIAMSDEKIVRFLDGKATKKIIVVKKKLVNIVI